VVRELAFSSVLGARHLGISTGVVSKTLHKMNTQVVIRDVAMYGTLCQTHFAMPRQTRLDAPDALNHVMVRALVPRSLPGWRCSRLLRGLLLVTDFGFAPAQAARHLGRSTAALKMLHAMDM